MIKGCLLLYSHDSATKIKRMVLIIWEQRKGIKNTNGSKKWVSNIQHIVTIRHRNTSINSNGWQGIIVRRKYCQSQQFVCSQDIIFKPPSTRPNSLFTVPRRCLLFHFISFFYFDEILFYGARTALLIMHYENTPFQIYWNFQHQKTESFQIKILIFFIFLLKT